MQKRIKVIHAQGKGTGLVIADAETGEPIANADRFELRGEVGKEMEGTVYFKLTNTEVVLDATVKEGTEKALAEKAGDSARADTANVPAEWVPVVQGEVVNRKPEVVDGGWHGLRLDCFADSVEGGAK